jgi:tRNA-intron endonuclease
MVISHLSGTKISSNEKEAFALCDKSSFGEKENGKVVYSGIEALYLVEQSKMSVFAGKKELDFEQLLKKIRKSDKKAEIKLAVFRDLRKKGYVLKTALKFGADFRVYDKGIKPGQDHALWLLQTFKENSQLSWPDFAAKARVAHSTNKKLLIGVVDEESDVSYYLVSWARP